MKSSYPRLVSLRLLAREVAKSHIVEGPQYSIYQKRDEI